LLKRIKRIIKILKKPHNILLNYLKTADKEVKAKDLIQIKNN